MEIFGLGWHLSVPPSTAAPTTEPGPQPPSACPGCGSGEPSNPTRDPHAGKAGTSVDLCEGPGGGSTSHGPAAAQPG